MSLKLKHYPIILAFLIIAFTIMTVPAMAADTNYRELPVLNNVNTEKTDWTMKFTLPIDQQSLNENNLYIINQSGQSKHSVKYELSADKKTLRIIPLSPYAFNTTYRLYIEEGIRSNTSPAIYLIKKSVMTFTTIKDKNAIPAAPQISLNIDGQTVTGTTSDYTFLLKGTLDKSAQVTVNGEKVSLSSLTFSQQLQLAVGNNSIEVIATDDFGQVSKKTATIKYEINTAGGTTSGTATTVSSDTIISSSQYTVNTTAATIIAVPANTTTNTFKNNINVAVGATIEVYQADKTTIRTGNIVGGDVLIVTAADKKTKKAYTITLASAVSEPPGNVVQLDAQTLADLKEVSQGLNIATTKMTTEAERALASAIKNNIDQKIANPSFDHTAQISTIRSRYRSLSDKERENFQDAVLASIAVQSLLRLAEFFGFQ